MDEKKEEDGSEKLSGSSGSKSKKPKGGGSSNPIPVPPRGMRRIVVGITGGSGVIYGIRFLEFLKTVEGVESHVIVSPAGNITIKAETDHAADYVEKLATKLYRFNDISASIASGSFRFDSMVVIPCSMHTLGAIASGIADNLVIRAAEVTLKERRRLILVPRESPLSLIHLENMTRVAQAGAVIVPAMPAFYERPKTIDDIVNHLVGKVLDLLDIENDLFERWRGLNSGRDKARVQ